MKLVLLLAAVIVVCEARPQPEVGPRQELIQRARHARDAVMRIAKGLEKHVTKRYVYATLRPGNICAE